MRKFNFSALIAVGVLAMALVSESCVKEENSDPQPIVNNPSSSSSSSSDIPDKVFNYSLFEGKWEGWYQNGSLGFKFLNSKLSLDKSGTGVLTTSDTPKNFTWTRNVNKISWVFPDFNADFSQTYEIEELNEHYLVLYLGDGLLGNTIYYKKEGYNPPISEYPIDNMLKHTWIRNETEEDKKWDGDIKNLNYISFTFRGGGSCSYHDLENDFDIRYQLNGDKISFPGTSDKNTYTITTINDDELVLLNEATNTTTHYIRYRKGSSK